MARESTLDKKIKKFCAERGAEGVKIHGNAFQSDIADWLICYKGRFIAIESKAADGTPTPGQKRFLYRVRCSAGIAELGYNIELLQQIFDSIDAGEEWIHGKL